MGAQNNFIVTKIATLYLASIANKVRVGLTLRRDKLKGVMPQRRLAQKDTTVAPVTLNCPLHAARLSQNSASSLMLRSNMIRILSCICTEQRRPLPRCKSVVQVLSIPFYIFYLFQLACRKFAHHSNSIAFFYLQTLSHIPAICCYRHHICHKLM